MAISILWDLFTKWTTTPVTNEVIFLHDKLTSRCLDHTDGRVCLNKDCYFYNVERIQWYLDNATHSLDLCMYLLSMSLFTESIIRAQRRGVTVRVITDHLHAYNPGSKVIDFLREGINVRAKPFQHFLMHHKFCVIDGNYANGILLTGSLNWTVGGVCGGNYENVVITTEKNIVKPHSLEFQRLWQDFQLA